MHIGVLTTSYPRAPDDPAGNFVAGLNRHLRRAGHRLTVVAAGDGGGDGAPQEAGITVRRVPSRLFYGGGAPDALRGPRAFVDAAGFSAALFTEAARALCSADLLVSHWVVPCGIAAALLARGRRHVAIAHSSDIHLLRRLRAESAVRWLAARAELVYAAAPLCVPGAPGRVVPMGIERAVFAARDSDEPARARASLGLGAGPVLATLSRLVPVKGIGVLLDALALTPGCILLIAGEGPDGPALRRQAAALGDRVRFLGEVRGEARRAVLLAADILVLPSLRLPDGRTEGTPTVLWEALAAGCALVASDVGGVSAVAGPCARLCPPGDVPALAAALTSALDPAWLRAAQAAAPERAVAGDWSRIAPTLFGGALP